jgi:thioredoxin 1
MKIQVLGTGCPKCTKTLAAVEAVVAELGMEVELEKVTDINEIMAFGVMSTPAVAIDGQVKICGRVPSQADLKKILQPSLMPDGGGSTHNSLKKKVLPIVALLIAVVGVVLIKGHKVEAPVIVTASESALPKLLDLGAGKCMPCKMMEPILEELTEAYAGQLAVEFIDVWENRAESEKYGIRMIPTQIFYDAQGLELFRHEGFFSKEDILAKWQELGVAL